MAMADVVQVVTPPRWSVTVTTPMVPEIEVAVVEETSEPRATLSVGAVMDSAPAVSVKLMGVAADAGVPVIASAASANTTVSEHSNFVFIGEPPNRGVVWAEAVLRVTSSSTDST